MQEGERRHKGQQGAAAQQRSRCPGASQFPPPKKKGDPADEKQRNRLEKPDFPPDEPHLGTEKFPEGQSPFPGAETFPYKALGFYQVGGPDGYIHTMQRPLQSVFLFTACH